MKKKYSTKAVIKFLWNAMRPYRGRFYVASLLRLSADLAFLFAPYALGKTVTLLSRPLTPETIRDVWFYIGVWFVVVMYRSTSVAFSKYYTKLVGYQTSLAVDVTTAKHLSRLDISWHERENSGNKLKRIQKALDGIGRILNIWISNYIEAMVNFTGMVIIIFYISQPVGFALAVFILLYGFGSLKLIRKVATASDAVNRGEEDADGFLFEIINNIRSVKVLMLASSMVQRLEAKLAKLLEFAVVFFKTNRTHAFYNYIIPNIFRFSAYGYIVWDVIHGRYEVGFLIAFWAYFNNIWDSIREISDLTQDFAVSKHAIGRLMDTLNEPVVIDLDEGKVDFPIDWKVMRLIGVSFAYGENQVLNNVSFEIKRGEKVGIVGVSGAGKSTIFKLLLKEHESFTGDILFDHTSIVEMRKSDYLKHVAVVLQDTEVFNFSLKDNITISDPDATNQDERLAHALDVAHVDEFLHKLPQGYETLIGEKGIKLSGGERQRLGIARAIYRNPEILFMDEATSHLDLESEEKIQDSLHKFFKSVTAVVIAHRLTTIKEMDRIIVIENGKIIESGSFAELRKKKGRFHQLWEKQKL